jgi:hypothetical protein
MRFVGSCEALVDAAVPQSLDLLRAKPDRLGKDALAPSEWLEPLRVPVMNDPLAPCAASRDPQVGRMRFARRLPPMLSSAGLASLLSAPVLGCPNCDTSRLARARVLDHQFWDNLLAITLPLMILGLVSALLYRIDLKEPTILSERTRKTEEGR